MLKRDLKNSKFDKKRVGKRHAGNANFRSLNNLQIYDKVPNDNLYKNDNLYSIKKNFEFSPNEEESFCLFFHYNYQINGIKGILILFYVRFCSSKINNVFDLFSFFKIFNLKNIFHLISFGISYFLANKKYVKESVHNLFIYYIFFVNQCIHIYNIYYKMTDNYYYYISFMPEIVFNYFFLLFLTSKIKHTFFPSLIIIVIYLCSIKRYLGLKLLYYCICGSIFSFLLYFFIKKSIREIWALFDSFKRSYYNLNQGLLESDPNPIFIISRDKIILYRNSSASKLIDNILENKNSPRKIQRSKDDRFNTMNILDIIHPNLKELFKKLLNDVMEDDKATSFNFPLCKINNQQDLNIDVSNAYDIFNEKNYLYFFWFITIICKTEWKGKTAFYMYFFPCEDILLNEIFYQFTKRFSEKTEKVVSNSDIICNALINKKLKENKESLSSSLKSDDKNSMNTDGNKKTLKKNIYQLLIENADNIELNNTILFFFKNQVELLYDYSLTIELYFNMLYKKRNFKYCIENTKPNLKKRIKLNELKNYYSEYFYDFAKEHKYKLQFKGDEEKNNLDIFIEENYLRIIMFNVIVFIICYLDDKMEPSIENKKEIIIKIIPELGDDVSLTPELGTANEDHYDKTPKGYSDSEKNIKNGELSFIFESFSTKADLNKVKELINQENKCGYHLKSEIIKLNYLDIGILAVNYLLQNYYNTNMEISNKEGEQIIRFKLPCDLEFINDSINIKKSNKEDMTPKANSFFTSPLLVSKHRINRPENFYNYNRNYNSKVLNIFYGIEKSPIHSRHKRVIPSFTQLNEIENRNKRYSRHLSQNLNKYLGDNKPTNTEPNVQNNQNEIKIININSDEKKIKKNSKKILNNFSFKQLDFSFDSNGASFKSDRIENEDISKDEENRIFNFNEGKDVNEEMSIEENKVLIIESQNNKEFISFLNNDCKGDYVLTVAKDINEVEKELENNEGKCEYKVVLINMGNNKEIKYGENICEKKGETLIYGYHFGAHTRLKEKNNVKFDKRFDLSFSYEGMVYALNQVFINSTSSIIK